MVLANDSAIHTLTASDLQHHADLVKHLSDDQKRALSKAYPDFKVLKLCPGNFSGADTNEFVLGIWKPVASKDWWKREVHRVGLIWAGETWKVHNIDDELEKDEDVSHSFPMNWSYYFGHAGFSAAMECGIDTTFKNEPNLTLDLGDKPLFDLAKQGLKNHKIVCFATSDVYNNWDCVVYSAKDGRFKLWYQQAHAD